MSYYSDVRIVTSKKGYEELSKFVKNRLIKENYNIFENPDFRLVTTKGVFIGWDNVKWETWDEFKDVNAIMDGLDYLETKNLPFNYARMGESYDDYDTKSHINSTKYCLPCLSIDRAFNDDYIRKELGNRNISNGKEKGVEI